MRKIYLTSVLVVFFLSTMAQQKPSFDEAFAAKCELMMMGNFNQVYSDEVGFNLVSPFRNPNQIMADKTTKQKLDSLYRYDYYSSAWNLIYRYQFTYNTAGKTILSLRSNWNESTSTWTNSEKTEYAYDSYNNMTLYAYYTWNTQASQWQPSMKQELSYDANQNPSGTIIYMWNTGSSAWMEWMKFEYTYSNQLLQIYTIYSYGGGAWNLSSKYEYSYNTNNSPTQYIRSNWDGGTSQWNQYTKYTYTYDANGNNTLGEEFLWDGAIWNNKSKTNRTFNANNKVTYEITQNWDGVVWVNLSKCDYTWDADQNLTERLPATWSASNQAWEYVYKYNHTYNNAYVYADLILPYTYTAFDNNHMRTEQVIWYYDVSNWVDNEKIEYYYSQGTIGVSELESKECSIYPNPTKDNIIVNAIDADNISIYDVQGRMVLENKIIGTTKVSVNKLNSGVYIYKLSKNNTVTYQGKLMVR